MDPLSQAVVGGIAGQNASRVQFIRIAGLLAFLSGTLADLDSFIRSDSDPLLYLEYHRQFTHSFIFMPVGGLIAALVFYPLFGKRYLSFKETVVYCTAGYATHALLDACTSYGTQLFWPFSDMRVAWNLISIIDPLFTLLLLSLILLAFFSRKPIFSKAALTFCISYLLLGALQQYRALQAGQDLAESRGHTIVRVQAKPSLGNLVVWKLVYEHGDRYYVDAIRLTGKAKVIEGESVARLDISRDFPWLDPSSQQAKDIQRFAWFSDNYLAVDRHDENTIVDMRYSMLPNRADGLWGIRLKRDAGSSEHVSYLNLRQSMDSESALALLWGMIVGEHRPKVAALSGHKQLSVNSMCIRETVYLINSDCDISCTGLCLQL